MKILASLLCIAGGILIAESMPEYFPYMRLVIIIFIMLITANAIMRWR